MNNVTFAIIWHCKFVLANVNWHFIVNYDNVIVNLEVGQRSRTDWRMRLLAPDWPSWSMMRCAPKLFSCKALLARPSLFAGPLWYPIHMGIVAKLSIPAEDRSSNTWVSTQCIDLSNLGVFSIIGEHTIFNSIRCLRIIIVKWYRGSGSTHVLYTNLW